ncbi:molybdenum cofactor guanylyltransferase [Archaeoglobales archaeon]|nr:MAG: molybdenum cofactor guanylyltransferase [Archaeoglobales archaeon]
MFAAILAGGKGRRLGGVEKGILKVGGKRIIEYILESLEDFEKVIVCRDEDQSKLYSKFDSTITDILKGMGPLGGIHAALSHFNDNVLVVSTDMPFLNREVCKVLYEECRNANAVIPMWEDGKFEPTLATYSTKVKPEIERCYRLKERRVIKAIERLDGVKYYPIEKFRKYDKELLTFMNINTPQDLEKAEKIMAKRGFRGF